MILNPSHKITLSGLPPDVLDAYVRYKKGTRAIVSWIVQYGPAKYHGARSLPLKELARLASSLAGTLKELPEVIHFHFRETIAARKRLSKYFRGNIDESAEAVDTVNHEHFTTSLTEIYDGLCVCCSKPKRKCETSRTERKSSDISEETVNLVNRFQRISLIEDQTEEAKDVEIRAEPCPECREQVPPSCPGPERGLTLADDDLGNRFQVAIILQQVCDYITATLEIWRQSAEGSIHFSTAAFATNVAYATLMRLEGELREVDEKIDLTGIAEMYCTNSLGNGRASGSGDVDSHNLIKQLQITQTAFKHYIDEHQPIKIVSCSMCMQRPADYVQSAPDLEETDQARLSSALIANLVHLIGAEQAPSNIARNSSPVYAELGHVLMHRDERPNTLKLTFGLNVLSESYQAYLLSNQGRAPSAGCRLTALKLAQQAFKSINVIIEDKNLAEDLHSYSRQQCWNLYIQSPWVAGNHILEMLDLCHYYGQKLFAYRHYVGAVVHSYNALQQLAGLQEIPLLEGLCNSLESTFFPGGRPKCSFRSCWTRYIGARIKFKKGHRTRNQRDSWCMAVPAHAARRAAGLGVATEARNHKDEYMLFKIKQQDYNITGGQWEATAAEQDPQSRLEALSSAIEKELFPKDETAIPAARINHFAVFASCVKIIGSLSDASHSEPKGQGINCICFAAAILDGADRILNARRMGRVAGAAWTKSEREGVLKLTIEAVEDEVSGLLESVWLWDV